MERSAEGLEKKVFSKKKNIELLIKATKSIAMGG